MTGPPAGDLTLQVWRRIWLFHSGEMLANKGNSPGAFRLEN